MADAARAHQGPRRRHRQPLGAVSARRPSGGGGAGAFNQGEDGESNEDGGWAWGGVNGSGGGPGPDSSIIIYQNGGGGGGGLMGGLMGNGASHCGTWYREGGLDWIDDYWKYTDDFCNGNNYYTQGGFSYENGSKGGQAEFDNDEGASKKLVFNFNGGKGGYGGGGQGGYGELLCNHCITSIMYYGHHHTDMTATILNIFYFSSLGISRKLYRIFRRWRWWRGGFRWWSRTLCWWWWSR